MKSIYYSEYYDKICYIEKITECILFSTCDDLIYALDITGKQYSEMLNCLIYLGEL